MRLGCSVIIVEMELIRSLVRTAVRIKWMMYEKCLVYLASMSSCMSFISQIFSSLQQSANAFLE